MNITKFPNWSVPYPHQFRGNEKWEIIILRPFIITYLPDNIINIIMNLKNPVIFTFSKHFVGPSYKVVLRARNIYLYDFILKYPTQLKF